MPIDASYALANGCRFAVCRLVKQSETNWALRLASIQALDGRTNEWWSKLHQSLQITPAEMPPNIIPSLLLIHIIYPSCLCTLHTSVVPLFTWSAVQVMELPRMPGSSLHSQPSNTQMPFHRFLGPHEKCSWILLECLALLATRPTVHALFKFHSYGIASLRSRGEHMQIS